MAKMPKAAKVRDEKFWINFKTRRALKMAKHEENVRIGGREVRVGDRVDVTVYPGIPGVSYPTGFDGVVAQVAPRSLVVETTRGRTAYLTKEGGRFRESIGNKLCHSVLLVPAAVPA